MIGIKLFLYDSDEEANGYRGEELSQYILSGAQNTENLTEELDLTEITLQGLPRSYEYEPETKFIIDIYEDDTRMATYHRVVQEDVVEKPILSNDEYYKHNITLIEPSVIAQKRIVDNISVTYKLKDVNLETRSIYSATQTAETSAQNEPILTPYATRGFGNYVDHTNFSDTRNCSFAKCFVWEKPDQSNKIKLVYTKDDNGTDVTVRTDLFYNDINEIKTVGGVKKAAFEVPVPYIYWGRQDKQAADHRPPQKLDPLWVKLGVASFRCDIIERDLSGEITNRYPFEFISNSNFGNVIDPNDNEIVDTSFPFDFAVESYPVSKASFLSEYLIENIEVSAVKGSSAGGGISWQHSYSFQFSRFSDRNNPNAQDLSNGYITTPEIVVNENCTYSINLSIINYKYGSTMPALTFKYVQNTFYSAKKYGGNGYVNYCYIKSKTGNQPYAQNVYSEILPDTSANSNYQFYGLDGVQFAIESGIPYTAYNLARKAIINSDFYYKTNGKSPVDIDDINSPYPFYLSKREDFLGKGAENIVTADDLKLIQINEAFYHQKNLWELLLEVGKYAHAIPQIFFGKNDKFAISFYKLGTTNQHDGENTPVSIMNFRKIDDYVSACSSYVDNLVQLGGEIKEIVAPKTDSEDYIVKNETAKIVVNKPIMELIKVEAIASKRIVVKDTVEETIIIDDGERADITSYIFEQMIYNILSVRYDHVPNKGIALYYELGTNEIKGGDYQLPQAVTNPYTDFSFKKILYSAFFNYDTTYDPTTIGSGNWYNIKINDFLFEVTYRTKDTARLEHVRPDLRHYLLASKHDRVPKHRQFNNQQDILVDSVSFGSNIFGKLVRTGNSNYKIREWCNNFAALKHKGELVIINGDWYYVSRATHIFFPEHIESVIDYSKDYNQLSEIIGIPSEPRFYEISERSAIDREIAITDYLIVSTSTNNIDDNDGNLKTITHLRDLVFGNGATYLKWAKTTFKGDVELEPQNVSTFGEIDFNKSILSPINAYSCGNTLAYEWDMEDNFSAGDEVSNEVTMINQPTADNAYRTMKAVQYCDKYGKATLFDFALYGDINFTAEQVRLLPNAPSGLSSEIVKNSESIILLKDSRETLHFNYNLVQITDSDRFVLSPFFFANDKGTIKIVALNEEVNKMSNGYINKGSVILENNAPSITVAGKTITIDMSWLSNVSLDVSQQIKSVAIIEDNDNSNTVRFIVARNGYFQIDDNWYIGAPNKSRVFTNKQ